MQTPVSVAAGQVTDILGRIASLTSEYEESMRLLDGLSGALGVMTDFLHRRSGDGADISPQAMSHALKARYWKPTWRTLSFSEDPPRPATR